VLEPGDVDVLLVEDLLDPGEADVLERDVLPADVEDPLDVDDPPPPPPVAPVPPLFPLPPVAPALLLVPSEGSVGLVQSGSYVNAMTVAEQCTLLSSIGLSYRTIDKPTAPGGVRPPMFVNAAPPSACPFASRYTA
jgi:hypothetical protein